MVNNETEKINGCEYRQTGIWSWTEITMVSMLASDSRSHYVKDCSK